MTAVRIGIIDSGACAQLHPAPQGLRFTLDGSGGVAASPLQPDRLGHGSAVGRAIHRYAPEACQSVAQVFDDGGRSSALQIAAALDWLCRQRMDIICMSLGVRTDHPSLARAIAAAHGQGVLLCASSPARGEPVYPAAYAGVLRVTGDARCAAHEWSWLGTAQADFGAAVRQDGAGPAGASMANAALCGHLAAQLGAEPGRPRAVQVQRLRERAHRHGPQTAPWSTSP